MCYPIFSRSSPLLAVSAPPPATAPGAVADRSQYVDVLHVIEVLETHGVHVGLVLHFV